MPPGTTSVKGRSKVLRRIEDVAREMSAKFLARNRKRLPHNRRLRRAKMLLLTGLPVTRILEVVDRLDPWMVVMGSEGRTGMARVMLGSKAERVVQSLSGAGDGRQASQATGRAMGYPANPAFLPS